MRATPLNITGVNIMALQPIRDETNHSVIQLLIDDRERAIIEILAKDTTSQWWRAQRLTYGDYALIFNASQVSIQTLMIIERKTFADFAQSFKDSRILNIAGLVALRAECPSLELAILVEGARSRLTSETEKINGIPYKNIRAKINHLRFRDKFHVFETQGTDDTIACLRGLVEDMTSLWGKGWRPLASGSIPGVQGASISGTSASGSQQAPVEEPSACIAARRPEPLSVEDEVRHMYEMFPGVGPKQAAAIIRAGISITAFVSSSTQIEPPDATKLSKEQARITRAMTRYGQERTEEMDRSILASITRVTPTVASALLTFAAAEAAIISVASQQAPTLAILCSLSREQLAAFRYKDKQWPKLCARVWECLHYGGGACQGQAGRAFELRSNDSNEVGTLELPAHP